jgi:hypothetical protein
MRCTASINAVHAAMGLAGFLEMKTPEAKHVACPFCGYDSSLNGPQKKGRGGEDESNRV